MVFLNAVQRREGNSFAGLLSVILVGGEANLQ
jgi:hypothetical protein